MGSTRRQQNQRKAILLRNQVENGGACTLALPGEWPVWGGVARCAGIADCVHHVKGRKVTGDDPRYLTAACTPCNAKIGEPVVDPAPTPLTPW